MKQVLLVAWRQYDFIFILLAGPKKGSCLLVGGWGSMEAVPRSGSWIMLVGGWDRLVAGSLPGSGQLDGGSGLLVACPWEGSCLLTGSWGTGQGLPALFTWRQSRTSVRSPPCGPPQELIWNDDVDPLNITHMDLCVRYDIISFVAHVGTLRASKLMTISECCILLNALE